MSTGYSSKNLKFPISKLTVMLGTNTDTETQVLCEKLGVSVVGEHVIFLKSSFKQDVKVKTTFHSIIVFGTVKP